MISLGTMLLAPRLMLGHIRFFRKTRSVRPREAGVVAVMSTLAVLSEAGGITMILPILSFVERGRDVAAFASSSTLAARVVDFYTWLGVPISILTLSATALIFIIARQTINYFSSIEIERVKWTIGRRLALIYFGAVLGSSATNIRSYKPGDFITGADYECQAVGAIFRTYGTIWIQIVSFCIYGAVLVVTAPLAAGLAGAVIACSVLGLGVLVRITRHLSVIALDFRRAYTNFLSERFNAWKLIKLGNTLGVETAKAADLQNRIVENQLHQLRVAGKLALIFVPVMSMLLLSLLYLFVEVLHLDVATVVLFILVLIRLTPVSQALQKQMSMLAQFTPAQERVEATFARARQYAEKLDAGRELTGLEREIRFDDVSYSYPDREHAALNNVTVAIPAYSMTAVIGPSGAGKSTFVDLIPRLIVPTHGQISIDNTPIEQFSLGSLRHAIAYVPQEPFLFDATIADNIRYLRPGAAADEIREAARLAHADEFIERTPKGYDTALGDSGAGLSVGQKQRVVLARAFLSGAKILILDEPTSALDYESEAAIQRAVEDLVAQGRITVIVIAHRLSTIRNADFVIELNQGRVARAGPAEVILGAADKLTTVGTAR